MNAIILSIGDELVLGQTVDTNAAWLSQKLTTRGISTRLHVTVADDRRAIAQAIVEAAAQADLIIATGGLGPTDDDLTRQALADAMGVELVLDESAVAGIQSFFTKLGRPMPERNKVQALCPVGATLLDNPAGTAPGICAKIGRAMLYSVPGVPREMMVLWTRHIEPRLPIDSGRVILTAKINTFGKGESDVAQLLGELMDRQRNPLVGTTVSQGIVAARIRSEAADQPTAQRALAQIIEQVESRLGSIAFGHDESTLADAVGALLKQRGATLATAESCTGGLIGKMLTDQPGASDFYYGGWITYANEAKIAGLGVNRSMLDEHGAVSEAVARAMATGALARSGADLAISVTGVAGPDGGTPSKPVGTVCFGLAERGGQVISRRSVLPGDREHVRLRAANFALNMVRLALLERQRA